MLTVTTVEELRAMAGQELGVSDFRQVTQEEVDEFAEMTPSVRARLRSAGRSCTGTSRSRSRR